MRTGTDPVRTRMAEANPAPPGVEPPEAVMTADVVLDLIDARSGAVAPGTTRHPLRTRPARPTRTWVWALVGGFAVALVTVGLAVLVFRGGTVDVVDQPTITTTVAPTTSVTPDDRVTEMPTTASTSAPEVVTTASFVGVVALDPDATAVQFGEPSLALDSKGRPQVLYRRTQTAVGLVTCADPECGSVSIRDYPNTASRVSMPRPDAGPVLWVGGGDTTRSGFAPEPVLVVCPDQDCAAPTILDDFGSASDMPAIATDASGRVAVATLDTGDGTVSLLQCFEPSCAADATSRTEWQLLPERWLGDLAVALRDGIPVLAVRTDLGVVIGECVEPECLPRLDGPGIDVVASVPIEGAVRGPLLALGPGGAPAAVVEVDRTAPGASASAGAIVVAACGDVACNTVVVTELAEIDDMYSEWAMATGPDGRVHIAWTEHPSLFLATCEDGTCSRHSIIDTGHHADDIALAFDPDGSPIIATMSRERGLELVYCGDDACRIAD